MLRMMEDIAKDEDELQNSFQTLDGCNGKSNHMITYMSLFKLYELKKPLTSARPPPVFTNAAETKLLLSLMQSSPSLKATLPWLVYPYLIMMKSL